MTATRMILTLAALFALSACGIKGDLFLPQRPDISPADVSKPAQEEPNK